MSDDFNTYTRVNRFEKKRKNTKAISLLLSLGALLVIVMIGLMVFGNKDDSQLVDGSGNSMNNDVENTEEDASSSNADTEGESQSTENQKDSTEEQDSESAPVSNQDPNEIEIETVPFEDDNVIEAYTANWEPLPTQLDGPFQFSWKQEEDDWNELIEASGMATGLSVDDIIDWWVTSEGTSGPNEFIATITNMAQTEIYRVYLSWIENQGFKPIKVEILKENDRKTPPTADNETESNVTADNTSDETIGTEDTTTVEETSRQ